MRAPDPIRLEVFHQLLAAICDESGALLRRCAASPNIRERLDFSCALYDAAGRLVSQAEHIPVHLGSAAESVAAARAAHTMHPGDVVVLNDPYAGGTHLPDVTMVRPIFLRRRKAPDFYAVNRAHHADIGGGTPGSMGVASDLIAEGLVIPPVKLRARGQRVADVSRLLLANVRGARERAIDFDAQEAALACAERRLRAMVETYGLATLEAYSRHLMGYAERLLRARLRAMPRGRFTAREWLESDGTGGGPFHLALTLTLNGSTIDFDFRKSAPQARGGINTNRSVVVAACAYVLRALAPSRLPTNEGLYRLLRVRTAPGTLLDPRAPAPVAGGNVETSQRLVDLILRALARALPGEIPAASAGTMTNLALGGHDRAGEEFAFYETLPGGAGASATTAGTSGVQTHMTNTRNTPIEDFEARYPLRVEALTVRRNSGGKGKHRGGDGVTKRVRALRGGISVSLFAERHELRPWGLRGGGDGAAGSAHVERQGKRRAIAAKGSLTLDAGDIIEVVTPGGGGYGRG